ncbi:unnamed protein product (macronuclear) [Paramecium tetraurelia]|uniref:Mini antigen n=1 Tax=Paramecium tetraurelia TaxID=5888 RepID=A0CM39_PARTE|nr:uncharacterized protein GSPATT00008335001 [Paramecium tetraurelia]CAK71856.1 unnamed protein product [Paramecium tetraurelia]|eukprot:XP_001439253.1 hypothetical protein (macronuclear) [Paramecium tetraurelia strain d4-2]
MTAKILILLGLFVIVAWQLVARCTCQQLFWEEECLLGGCFWKNDICIQVSCENRISDSECNQTTTTDDWNPNCKWVDEKCLDIDTYHCNDTCTNSSICEVDDTESCQIKYTLDRKHCSDFSTNNCNIQLSNYEFCEKHDHACSSVTYETKCNEILTEKACNGLGCYWDAKKTQSKCNSKECLYFDQPNCLWTINGERKFTFCSWNETRAFCQESNDTTPFTNISRCSLDSNFIYHFDNSTGNQECQACVDPAELYSQLFQIISFAVITLY